MTLEHITAFHALGFVLVVVMLSAVVTRHPLRRLLMGAVGIWALVAALLRG